jgi:hypothetical protein
LPLGAIGARACFVAGTQVVVGMTDDGRYVTKAIEDLKVGDRVLARSQCASNGDVEERPIERLFRRVSDHLRVIQITDAGGEVESIKTTDEHPFWVQGVGWIGAGELKPGMRLLEADGSGDAYVLTSSRYICPDGIVVFNFEVSGDHTYFVADDRGATDVAVWVHNTCATQLRAALKATKQAVVFASRYGLEAGVEAAAHLVPRGKFSNRSRDVVDAIKYAQRQLKAAGIGINQAINGLLTTAKNQMGTHSDRYFRRMAELIHSYGDDVAGALKKLKDEVVNGDFLDK